MLKFENLINEWSRCNPPFHLASSASALQCLTINYSTHKSELWGLFQPRVSVAIALNIKTILALASNDTAVVPSLEHRRIYFSHHYLTNEHERKCSLVTVSQISTSFLVLKFPHEGFLHISVRDIYATCHLWLFITAILVCLKRMISDLTMWTSVSFVFIHRVRQWLVTGNFVPSPRIFSHWWWRRYISPKRRYLQEPHSVTSKKTAFITVTAVKRSNLT
jgi:hypothetical protein